MKDTTVPDPKDRKKIMFYESPDQQVRFRIRCQHEGLSQSQFFRLMLRGYVEGDELVQQFLKNCKEKYQIQGKNKRDKLSRIQKSTTDLKNKFSLAKDDIESIYDMLETED